MTRSTHRCLASLSFTLAALALTGCMAGGEPGDGSYPLAEVPPCDRLEGTECDPRAFDETCALADDFTRSCRCVAEDDAAGRGRVVCDGRTPVPPLPTYCADDVLAGRECAEDEAGRVCGLADGARCICAHVSAGSDTDPAGDRACTRLAWVCELPPPGPGECPPDARAGGVCFGYEGTYCTIGDATRCRCIDDPRRDGLTVWECEGPGSGEPTSCDEARIYEGAACEPDAIGARCASDGRTCECGASPDGEARGIWHCTAVEPSPSCDERVVEGARCDSAAGSCILPGRTCECGPSPDGADASVWHCRDLPPPPPDPTYCAFSPDTDAVQACGDIGARCLFREGGGACVCIESSDPRVPAEARGTWRCDASVPGDSGG